MKAVVQRVKYARVVIDGKTVSSIKQGFLVFLGIKEDDNLSQAGWLAKKIADLRIISDAQGKMNQSLIQVNGEVLVVSQFTLYGDCQKGNRPSFIKAARPEKAKSLYQTFINKLKDFKLSVKSGVFQAMMEIELINDGPVTIILEK